MSVAYCEEYGKNVVEKLILISPAGVGERPSEEELKEKAKNSGWFYNLAAKLWEYDFSPQGIARGLGPLGKRIIAGYTERRFGHLKPEEHEHFTKYFENITIQKGSGEYCVSKLLLPGAWARFPLHNRVSEFQFPVSFMYGSTDWMDFRAALKCAPMLKKEAKVIVIQDAGHHLYSDNQPAFDKAFLAEVLSSKRVDDPAVCYEFDSQRI